MSNLESLRKEAKSLLKQCRAGNTAALARVRSQLPRLGLHIQLADVQHAIARQRNADDDYSAVVQAIFNAGGTWIDRWESSPEAIASPAIAALLRRLNSN